jgi:hypothetical protein
MANCCSDQDHVPNSLQSNFPKKIIGGAERVRKTIRDHRNLKVENLLWLMAGTKTIDEASQEIIDDF